MGSTLLALGAELVLYRNCNWTEEREFRLKQRNHELILFLMETCVKVNRKLFFLQTEQHVYRIILSPR
jgi:hypothetical protein